MRHELKCWPKFYESTMQGLKRFELRRDDWGFKVGDELLLKEWNPVFETVIAPLSAGDGPGKECVRRKGYTGREVLVRVDYIMDAETLEILMRGDNQRFFSPTPPDCVIMSVSLVK